jgi:hypothetical protein
MYEYKFKEILTSFGLTALMLIGLEVFSSSFLPAIGWGDYRLGFHVLICLYVCFRVDSMYLPYLIMGFQLIHSVFTIEGWALGTFTGVIVSFLVSFLKDMIQLNSKLSTMIVVQIFQTIWFVIMGILISIKLGDFAYLFDRFWRFLPESLMLSLVSPFFFIILAKFWGLKRRLAGASI